MTVEKAEKGTYTVDGKNETCKGYTVNISKDSMVDFLRTSADFFLQDEELKSAFLKQLETTVKLSQLLGNDHSLFYLSRSCCLLESRIF